MSSWSSTPLVTDASVNAKITADNAVESGTYARVISAVVGESAAATATRVNAALAATSPLGIAMTVRLEGDFTYNAPLVVKSRTTLDGAAATVTFTGNSTTDAIINADTVNGNVGLSIRDLTLIGPEDGTHASPNGTNTGRGINLRKCDGAKLTGNTVSRFWLQGIQVNLSARAKITGNTVTEIKGGNGISIDEAATDCLVTGNTITAVADCGIGVHNGSVGTVVKGNVVDNTAYGRGIDIYGAPGTIASNNVLTGIGTVTPIAAHGIQVSVGLAGQIPNGCVITGNTITAAADGIQVWADNATATNDTLISGNMIFGSGLVGVGVHVCRKAVRTTVVGNHVKGGSYGIMFEEGAGLVPSIAQVSANTVSGCINTGVFASASVTGITGGGNSLMGNGALVTLPAGNSLLYEAANGFQQLFGGITIGELYVTSLYSSGVLAHSGMTAGFYGHAAVARAAHPVTLADVITALTNLGLTA